MRTWLVRLVVAGILLGFAIWGWRTFFPGPERAIRKTLGEVAQLATFGGNEGPLAKALNTQKLLGNFTSDIQFVVDLPGRSQQLINGIEDLQQAVMAARNTIPSLSVTFPDIHVQVLPGKESAIANVTVEARMAGEKDLYVQELKINFKKQGTSWRISRIETVRTLR